MCKYLHCFTYSIFPVFIGKEEKERGQLETPRRERTEIRDCASGMSNVDHTKSSRRLIFLYIIIRAEEIKHSDWLRVSHEVYFNQP